MLRERASRVRKKTDAFSKVASHRMRVRKIDSFQIGNPDPDREYRFISRSMLAKMGGADPRGWQPITEHNRKDETLINKFGIVTSGTDLAFGDLVLAFMPKQHAEMRRAEIEENGMLARQAIYEARDLAERYGALDEKETDIDVSIQRDGISQ